MKKLPLINNIKLGKLVHGGQCLAEAPDGRKLFVWGGLPDELVDVQITKKKSSYLEGIVTIIHKASPDRIEPIEPETYLSSSPWQIIKFEAENRAKQAILEEAFTREGLQLKWQLFVAKGKEQPEQSTQPQRRSGEISLGFSDEGYAYRNKVEFGFWGDEDGIHLAQYVRGTHGKQIITGNALAMPQINMTVVRFIHVLNKWSQKMGLRAGDFKTMVLRASQAGEVVAALFVKRDIDCSEITLPEGLKGLVVYYSNPKSPASLPSKLLYSVGDIKLQDTIMSKNIIYDVLSFFQVNLPVFEAALKVIATHVGKQSAIDMYSGVGTIGVAVGAKVLVESDDPNIAMARENTHGTDTKVIHANAESAVEYITSTDILIVDPPRAGLHRSLVQTVLDKLPSKIIYLSCNPSTQARDIVLLKDSYVVLHAQGFNFFPRTPHIESLVVLDRK